MFHRYLIFTICLIFVANCLYSQKEISLEKSVLVTNIKSKKFSKEFVTWVEKQTLMEVVFNNKTDSIKAGGRFIYENTVKYPGSTTIGRMYTNQTNGYIVYDIYILCREDHYSVRLCNFRHQSSSHGDKIEFGLITDSANPPKHLMLDYDADWCTGVWANLKEQCTGISSSFYLQLSGEMANVK